MLEELRIRDLGVIEDAVLELGPGFTAITGETGAGKTMLLTGLSLLFGGKADTMRVRVGSDKAHVDGVLHVADDSSLIQRLDALDASHEDGVLLVSRSVAAEGRGRAVVGGRPVPVSVLAEIADDFVAIHGQADQRRLLQPAQQRAMVDRFAGSELRGVLTQYRGAFDALKESEAALAQFLANSEGLRREAEQLSSLLAEIEKLKPVSGEESALREEALRLSNVEGLREAATRAHALLGESLEDAPDVLTALAQARKSLEHQGEHDQALAALAATLKEPASVIADVVSELGTYLSSLDADPQRLARIENRRAELTALARRIGVLADDLPQWGQESAARLAAIDDDGTLEQRLRSAVDQARQTTVEIAAELTRLRQQAAGIICQRVTTELEALSMPNTELQIDISPAELGPFGADEVDIRLAAGRSSVPLAKGASGGELSRVMLAIEVVIAAADPVPTMVFDEVDAGVGGRAAVEIGRRLCRLAADTQVLVVTHLPQVAAFADRHVIVHKDPSADTVSSGVRMLSQEERVTEVARMLAGLEDSEAALAHAQELLALAETERIQREKS